jgi:heme exporter protein C
MPNNVLYAIGAAAGLFLLRNLHYIMFSLPDEARQGPSYRIFFYHLPPYFTAVVCFLAAAIASGLYLKKREWKYDTLAVSATEAGLAFAAMNLVTGMIWGRFQWGIWWTWDARLTSALITWLIYLGYLMLRKAINDPSERGKNAAVLNIFALFAIYFTYKANEWYRTQHPGPVLTFRTGDKSSIDPAMQSMLFQNWVAFLLLAAILIGIRMRIERSQREIDSLRRAVHAYS